MTETESEESESTVEEIPMSSIIWPIYSYWSIQSYDSHRDSEAVLSVEDFLA